MRGVLLRGGGCGLLGHGMFNRIRASLVILLLFSRPPTNWLLLIDLTLSKTVNLSELLLYFFQLLNQMLFFDICHFDPLSTT